MDFVSFLLGRQGVRPLLLEEAGLPKTVFQTAVYQGAYQQRTSREMVMGFRNLQPITLETHPDIYRTVTELADKAGVAMPELYTAKDDDVPNAWANITNHSIVVSEAAIRKLDYGQLTHVLAHEMAHFTEEVQSIGRNISRITRPFIYIQGIFMVICVFSIVYFVKDETILRPLVVSAIASIPLAFAAQLVNLATCRKQEVMADNMSIEYTDDPLSAISYEEHLLESLADLPWYTKLTYAMPNWISTHPSPETRMENFRRFVG